MDNKFSFPVAPFAYATGLLYCLKNTRFEIEKSQNKVTAEFFKKFVQSSIDIAKFALDHIVSNNPGASHPLPENQLWKFYNFISQNYTLCAELILLPLEQEVPQAKISHHIDCVWEILTYWEGFIYHNNITKKIGPNEQN